MTLYICHLASRNTSVDKILQLVLLGQNLHVHLTYFWSFEISLLSSLPGHKTLLNCGFLIKFNIQFNSVQFSRHSCV